MRDYFMKLQYTVYNTGLNYHLRLLTTVTEPNGRKVLHVCIRRFSTWRLAVLTKSFRYFPYSLRENARIIPQFRQ
jgi:hypothetical protein